MTKYTNLDIAVAMEKAIILNGIIATSESMEERKNARKQFMELRPVLEEMANSFRNSHETALI
jgi:hypothetical protein